jgi:hypothetical protein
MRVASRILGASALMTLTALAIAALTTMPAGAIELTASEAAARGFPAMRTLDGKPLGDGDFVQWLEGGRVHIKIVYRSPGGRIEERAVFRQRPELIQESWSWRELRQTRLYRAFDVDFSSGLARAKKGEEAWSDKLEIEPGRTFAGFGFTLAIKGLRSQMVRGQHAELRAIGFTPKPKAVGVDVSYAGAERVSMAGRVITGDHFVIHAKIPWFAEPFVEVPDTHLWLTTPPAVGFLRWEGPLAEPSDQVIRVDLLPGGRSGSATAAKAVSDRQ